MSYLIDTDWIIDYLTGQPDARATLTALRADTLAISLITLIELYEGAYTSRDPDAAEAGLQAFLQRVTLLAIDQDVALAAARIRATLRRNRRPIKHRSLDLLIAATAIAHGLELVTRNRKDFADIPGLVLFQAS